MSRIVPGDSGCPVRELRTAACAIASVAFISTGACLNAGVSEATIESAISEVSMLSLSCESDISASSAIVPSGRVQRMRWSLASIRPPGPISVIDLDQPAGRIADKQRCAPPAR